MGFFYFLGRKKFYIHLGIILLLIVILFFGVLKSLDIYTQHGKVYLVPDFYGKTVDQLIDNHYDEYFDLIVIDSVYDKRNEKGAILMQNPKAGSKVKQGRHIYLTVVAQQPEKTMMPNLKNLSLRQAIVTLEMNKLKVGHLNYVDYFARNAVIDQLIDDETIEEGTEINTGTEIDLVVGKGKIDVKVNLPLLIAKKPKEAVKALHYASLNKGKEYFMDVDDSSRARVYKTEPDISKTDLVELGKEINIWYRSDESFDFDSYLLKFTSDTLDVDSASFENNAKINNEF
ncbi:MAG: PASTA domain-containing protein [Chlorobi bacterium]|nr:PASTA domain-containing protein [Chlorobiota bacterium]